MIFHDAWILTRKDLRLFFRDRTAVALTLALPILLATIFGSAMGAMTSGGGGGPQKVDLQVEDQDDSEASRILVERLQGADGLRITVAPDARRAVASGDMPAALVLPEGYGASVAAGEPPEMRLLRDPARGIAHQVIIGNLMPVVWRGLAENGGMGLQPGTLDIREFIGRAFSIPGVVTEDVAGREDDDLPKAAGASHAVAAMAVMMLMFSLVAAGGTLLEEQAGGTLLRLQLSPSAGPAILLGKLVSMGLIGLLQLLVLYTYGGIVFDVPVMADPVGLAVVSVGVVLAATGLGLTFATLCTSRKQLEGLSTLVILVMSAVGGAWFPREMTPEWFKLAGQFTITAYAMDAFHGILWYGKGILPSADLGGVWVEVAVLYGTGIVLAGLSLRLYRRRFVDAA